MSTTKGKFYIRLCGAYASPYYWNQPAQNYTKNPHDCTLFDSLDAAMSELLYAERTQGESAEVLQVF